MIDFPLVVQTVFASLTGILLGCWVCLRLIPRLSRYIDSLLEGDRHD